MVSNDDDDVPVTTAAGIAAGTGILGLLLGLPLGWLLLGVVFGCNMKGKHGSADIATNEPSRNGSDAQVKFQRKVDTGSFVVTTHQEAADHASFNCPAIYEESNGNAQYTEPVGRLNPPDLVERTTSVQSAGSTKPLLDSPSSDGPSRSEEKA